MAAKVSVYRSRPKYMPPPKSAIVKSTRTAAEHLRHMAGEARQSVSAITEFGEKLKADQQTRTDTYEHMVNLFTSRHELGIDADKRYVDFDFKGSKAADVILRVMGMLTVNPQFQFIGPEGHRGDDEKAGALERHINAFYPWYVRKHRGRPRWDYQNRFWQLLLGVGYVMQSHDAFAWDKNELKRRTGEEDKPYNQRVAGYRRLQGPPVTITALDPRTVWPLPSSNGENVYIRQYRVQRYDFDVALARRGKTAQYDDKGIPKSVTASRAGAEKRGLAGPDMPIDAQDNPTDAAIDYWEYIDDEWVYYVCDDTVIDEHHHKGALKIFPCFGYQTGFAEAHLQSLGMLWAVRNQIPQHDFLRTLWSNHGYLAVFPQLFAQLADGEDTLRDENGAPQEWKLEPGTVKQIRGQLINAMREGSSMPDFQALVTEYGTEIDLATISNIARGVAGAQQAGYALNQLSQSMRTAWKPFIDSAQEQMAAMAEHYLEMKRTIGRGETWSVYAESEEEDTGRRRGTYESIEDADIPDYFRIECSLDPDLPIDKQGTMLTWSKLYADGNATFEEFTREGMGLTNVIARRKQLDREAMRKALMPKIVEDALALGRTNLSNELLKARGLDQLNTTFSMDLAALKAARSGQVPGMENGAAGPPAPGGDPMAMAGGVTPPLAQAGPMVPGGNPNAGPMEGGGIPPTTGANPNNPTPGPRL